MNHERLRRTTCGYLKSVHGMDCAFIAVQHQPHSRVFLKWFTLYLATAIEYTRECVSIQCIDECLPYDFLDGGDLCRISVQRENGYREEGHSLDYTFFQSA